MANASADKLKALGIKHGEKAVVGLSAVAFLALTFLGITNKSLDMQPDQLKTAATNAQSNLQKKQTEPDILAKLEHAGLKEPNFQKTIEGQIANALKPDEYRARLDWVVPEPGAGLIRDQPELIAPVDLTAFPGRGGVNLFALDEKGDRILDTGESKTKTGSGKLGGMAAAAPGGGDGKTKKETAEEKRKRELEEEKRKAAFVGKVDPANPDKKDAAQADVPTGPWKEELKGKRWVVITATLDNAKLKKNYLQALKNEAIAYPNYKRVDVERQVRQSDGSWSEWTPTEKEKNWAIIDNLTETDVEYVPDSQRPSALVDPLPFLKAGYWTGVHVAKLVPAEILNKPADTSSNSSSSGPKGAPAAPGMQAGSNSASRQGGGGGKLSGASMGGPGAIGGPGMGSGSTSAGGGGSADEANFLKYDAETVMIRSLDFTVEPDQTYRFRLRIVVYNPNYEHDDVNPGVDVTSKNLVGPWSEPSPVVSVPADVVAYAQAPDEAERRDDLVTFQVVKWDPASGHTVIKTDVRGPGGIIGEYGSVPMPSSEGKGPKSERIDFNSRSIVLDTFGGRQKLPDIGVPRNQFDVPALAMIVEPDGTVIIRSQALDKADEVRQDMEANYKQAIEDSNQEREKGSSNRGPGGMAGKFGSGKKKGKNNSNSGGASRQGGGGASRQGN